MIWSSVYESAIIKFVFYLYVVPDESQSHAKYERIIDTRSVIWSSVYESAIIKFVFYLYVVPDESFG